VSRNIFLIIVFILSLGLESLTPILPLYVEKYNVTITYISLIFTLYSTVWASLQFLTGKLSDFFGRKLLFGVGWLISGICIGLLPLAINFNQFLLLRVIQGFGTALWGPTGVALAIDIFTSEKGRGLGIYRSVQNSGMILGPIIGGFISSFLSPVAPFYIASLLTCLGGVFIIFYLPEPKINRRSASLEESIKEVKSIVDDLKFLYYRERIFFKIALIGLIGEICYASLSLLPIYAAEKGAEEFEIGLLFTAYMLVFIISQSFIGSLSDRIGRKPIILLGCIGSALNFYIIASAKVFIQILIAMALLGLTLGAIYVISTVMIADIAPATKIGSLIGLYDSIIDLGFILGPIIFGVLSDKFGMEFSYIFFTILLTFAALLAMSTKETLPERT